MDKIDIKKFTPVGTKFCEGKCDRQVIKTPEAIKVVCFGCKRIVMERPN
jgi:hypothetical protein